MYRTSTGTWLMIIAALLLVATSCTKERILESTEYIETTEYIQLPADTVVQVVTITDTVYSIQYDTVRIIDSVSGVADPNVHLAISALQYYNNPLVIEFVRAELGLSDGWIFYLSEFQTDRQEASPGVYDFYGYINFWAPDWSGYYPFDYLWRITHTGGDPSVSSNWALTESPLGVAGYSPGLHFVKESARAARNDR